MDDLISRKAAIDALEFERDCIDWVEDAIEIIQQLPSINAVPLDKLCEVLAGTNYVVPCGICEYRDTYDCEIFPCPSTAEKWRNALTKWMEGQHENK